VLTKTVLRAAADGVWKLIEVPFAWHPGDAIPEDSRQETFPSAAAAMSVLADRGRKAQRIHVAAPEAKPRTPKIQESH
jgi:hypothetical protein